MTIQTERRPEERAEAADAYGVEGLPGEDHDISLISIWHTILRRKLLVILVLVLALIAGVILALQPRKYVASGSLQIRTGAADRYKVQVSQLGGSDSDERIESGIAILQSKALYTKVAEDLHLAANPAVVGSYASNGASMQDPYVQARVITAMRKMIVVERTPKTQIITISCESKSPLLASEIVNTLMNEYVEGIFKTRFSSTQRAAKFLSQQLEDLKNQVLNDQRQLVDLQGKLGGIGIDDTHNLVTSQLEDLARANQQANIERITAEARYRILQDEKPDLVDGGPAMLTTSQAPGGTLLQTLRSTRAQVSTQYASINEQFGPNYPEAKRLKAQLAEATQQVNAEEQRVLEQAKVAFEAAQRNQRMTNDALDQQKGQAFEKRNDMVSYQILLHDYQSSRTLYEELMQRLREAGVTSGLESSEVELVDLATLPVTPSGYGPVGFVSLCLGIGLAFALAAAMLLQSLDSSVTSADELERYLRLPLLAILPSFVPAIPATQGPPVKGRATLAAAVLEVLRAPQSHFAEGIRLLRTSLLLSRPDAKPKRLLFTSSTAGEGKSTVSSNEACMLAMNGARVLLIDADMRRPSQHIRFNVPNRVGLSTFLIGESHLEDIVSTFEDVPSLHLLTSGPLPPSPGDLLSSKAMQRLLQTASEQYDFVLLDTPPSLAITDAALLAEFVDTVVLVVRSGVANKRMVTRTLRTLTRLHASVAGFVFNGVDKRSADYYEYKQYDQSYTQAEVPMQEKRVLQHTMRQFVTALGVSAICFQAVSMRAQYLGGSPQRRVNSLPSLDTSAETVQTLLHAPKPSLLLMPSDTLTVHVFEIEKYEYKTRIASDGTISLPLIDTVSVAGKTIEQAEAAIVERLETLGMVKNPHVQLAVSDQPSQFFTVAGEVNKPGTFPAYGERTLLAAIAQGGGLNTGASRNVTLLRAGTPQGYALNLGSDPSTSPVGAIPIYSGDTILVGSAGVIYVVGAVKLSGVYKLKTSTPTTVEEAIAEAGGAGFEAERNETRIVRVVDGRRIEIPVKLKRTMHDSAEDPVLQADDILFIPTNEMRAAVKGGGANIAVGLATAAIIR